MLNGFVSIFAVFEQRDHVIWKSLHWKESPEYHWRHRDYYRPVLVSPRIQLHSSSAGRKISHGDFATNSTKASSWRVSLYGL